MREETAPFYEDPWGCDVKSYTYPNLTIVANFISLYL